VRGDRWKGDPTPSRSHLQKERRSKAVGVHQAEKKGKSSRAEKVTAVPGRFAALRGGKGGNLRGKIFLLKEVLTKLSAPSHLEGCSAKGGGNF